MPPVADVTRSSHPAAAGDLLLVVDAGGTKTAAWLVDPSKSESDCVLGRGRATAGNPLSVGFPEAARAIAEAVGNAKHDAHEPTVRVPRAILSIAGTANDGLRNQFIESLRDIGLANQVALVCDALPILAAASPDCCGVALIAGTGSVAYARAADGKTCLCGGWGYLLGDEGSGYAIGRAALQLALHELEASKTRQPLVSAVLDAIGAGSTLEVTRTVYRSADPRATIASLAQVVLAAGDEGDAAAQAIVDAAARDLAQLVARAVRSIGFVDTSISLAVAGSALVKSRRLPEQLRVELRRIGLAPELTVVGEPLQGCIRLAAPECSSLLQWHAM